MRPATVYAQRVAAAMILKRATVMPPLDRLTDRGAVMHLDGHSC